MRGSADNEPDPDERIDDTQKNEVRRFSQEIGETFGQSVLEIRGADLAHRRSHQTSALMFPPEPSNKRSRGHGKALHKAAGHRKPRCRS
jgi:hypothetical protein